MTLPTMRSEPGQAMADFTCLLYGDTGIGKTSFLADLTPTTLICDTEKGAKLQKCWRQEVKTWTEFCSFVDEFCRGKHEFDVVAIDTIGRLVLECTRHCVRELGVTHPSDAGFGKGYDVIKKTFSDGLSCIKCFERWSKHQELTVYSEALETWDDKVGDDWGDNA